MSDNVLVKSDGPITRITLNRPEKRNAMSLELMADLTGTLEAVRHDEDTRVVVIAASGPAFSAGHDLGEMASVATLSPLPPAVRRLHGADERDPHDPAAGHREGARRRNGRRMSARRRVRSRGCRARAHASATPGVKIGLFCSTPMVPHLACGRAASVHSRCCSPASCRREHSSRVGARQPRRASRAAGRRGRRSSSTRSRASSALTVGIGKEAFYAQIELDERRRTTSRVPS